MIRILKHLFFSFGVLFIATAFTGAYFVDNSEISGNSFETGYWSDMVINEIYANPASGEIEWIELYNGGSAIDLIGYTIEDNNESPKDLSSYSVATNGYLVLEKGTDFSFGLNDPGDVIVLKNTGGEVDKVAYGNYDDGNIIDNAPKPAKGESVARIPNGVDTDIDIDDFEVRSEIEVTKGSSNG